MTHAMKVFGTASSPFTRKVRIVAHEKGLPVEYVVDSPMTADSGIAAMNPLGKIPVLTRADGSTLIDSNLIAEYLDTLKDTPRLIPVVGPEHFDVRECDVLAAGIMDAAVLIRMESIRAENERSEKWIARQRGKIDRTLEHMNKRLAGRQYCVGLALTVADISLGCAVSYLRLRFPEVPWTEQYVNVGRVAAALEARESFKSAPMHA
jgi:glutathione S-transferase